MQTKKLYPVEIIVIIYVALTALYLIVGRHCLKDATAWELLLPRIACVLGIGALYLWNRCAGDVPLIKTCRNILPLGCILYFYPETYYLGRCIFPEYLDPVFIKIDQVLFGCQPSTVFSEAVPFAWFSELMNLAYISYFFTIFGIIVYLYCRNRAHAYRAACILLCSFFVYYLLFIVLPVAGPQFYVFDHDTALPVQGPIRKILLFFHSFGEKPTGAVPSSHVGIMVIYMLLLWQHSHKAFWRVFPLSFLLMLSTVYIRAHYAIDVLLGLATAPVIYLFGNWCWKKLSAKTG
jgi:membrane-associated phospholipid phosphatase